MTCTSSAPVSPRAVTIGRSLPLALLVAVGFLAATAAHAGVLEDLAAEGCEATLPALESAVAADPGGLDFRRALAECRVELTDYSGVNATIDAAPEAQQGDPRLQLALAKAAYHLGDAESSASILAPLAEALGDRADYFLYDGMSALALGDARRAAPLLDRARRIDPGLVEPVASFYAGLAWREVEDPERSDEAWDRVVNDWPSSPWAERVERERNPEALDPLSTWAEIEVGLEYDSNVRLVNDRVELTPEIERDDDGRFVWFGRAGASYALSEVFSVGAQIAYSGSQHFRVEEFDVHYPTLGLWLDTVLPNGFRTRVLYATGVAWVDIVPGNEFFYSQDLGFSVIRDSGRLGITTFEIAGGYDEYLFRPVDIDVSIATDGRTGGDIDERSIRELDQSRVRVGLGHRVPIGDTADVGLSYEFESVETQGSEFDRDGHTFQLDGRTALPLAVEARGRVAYSYRPYDNPSSFPSRADFARINVNPGDYQLDPLRDDRSDHRTEVGLALKRPIGRGFSVRLDYSFTDNDSNVEAFDTEWHVVGAYLEWLWP